MDHLSFLDCCSDGCSPCPDRPPPVPPSKIMVEGRIARWAMSRRSRGASACSVGLDCPPNHKTCCKPWPSTCPASVRFRRRSSSSVCLCRSDDRFGWLSSSSWIRTGVPHICGVARNELVLLFNEFLHLGGEGDVGKGNGSTHDSSHLPEWNYWVES